MASMYEAPAGPGALPTFGADVQQSTRVREFTGIAGDEAAKVFGNLSQQLGQWEDRAAADVGKQQGEALGASQTYRPDNDESVMGIARRNAAIAAYGNNVEAGARNDVGNAWEQYGQLPASQQTPARLQDMFGKIKQDYDQNHVFDQVKGPFDLKFGEMTDGYLRQAQSDLDTRTRQAAQVSFQTNMLSAHDNLQRMASLPSASPADLASASRQAQSAIDNAVDQHLLSPEQAAEMKRGLTTDASTTHIWSRFISLPPGEARMRFAEQFNNSVGGGGHYFAALKRAESGGNPTAGDPAQAYGLYQFMPGTWQAVSQAHPDLGLTPDGRSDPAQQEKAIRAFTTDNETVLRGAGIPITNQNRYMASFLGVGGAIHFMHAMSADPNAPFTQVFPREAAANPAIANGRSLQQVYDLMGQKIGGGAKNYGDTLGLPFQTIGKLQGAMEGQLRSDMAAAETAEKQALGDIAAKRKLLIEGTPIPEDDWSAFKQQYGASASPKVAEAFRLTDISRNIITGWTGKSPGEMEQMQAGLHAQIGANPSPEAQQVLATIDGYVKKYREDLAQAPLNRAVSQGLTTAPPALDVSSAQNLAQTIRARSPIVAQASQKLGVPVPFFSRDEGADFAQKISRADVPLAAAADPASLAAMSEDEGFRKALIANSRSGDPQRMHGAFTAMRAVADAAPMEFDARFGKEAASQLNLWDSLQNYTAPEAAKMMLALSDPSQAAARKSRDEAADVSLKTMTPASVLRMFSQRQVLNPLTWTSGAPEPPVTATDNPRASPDALLGDYREAYKTRFALDGSADAASSYALQAVQKKWGVSEINGGRLMPYPPERFYPAVEGGYGWIGAQLDADVKKAAGNMGVTVGDLPVPTTPEQIAAARKYGAPRALVADAQTRADIEGGRPPSYRVVIQDQHGQYHALEQSPGTPFRFFADPTAPRAEAAAKFNSDRDLYRRTLDTPATGMP